MGLQPLKPSEFGRERLEGARLCDAVTVAALQDVTADISVPPAAVCGGDPLQPLLLHDPQHGDMTAVSTRAHYRAILLKMEQDARVGTGSCLI